MGIGNWASHMGAHTSSGMWTNKTWVRAPGGTGCQPDLKFPAEVKEDGMAQISIGVSRTRGLGMA
jgi:hypothetical protein